MRRLLLFAVLLISITSCQKDVEPLAPGSGTGTGGVVTPPVTGTPAAAGTISASVSGVATTYNTAAQAIRTNVGGMSSISVVGFKGAGGVSDQISITISSITGVVTVGTYLYEDLLGTGTSFGSIGLVNTGDPSPFASFLSTTNPTKVIITSVSSTSIAGTFSGDIYQFNLTTGLEGPKKPVTNGKFNVKIN